MSFPSYRLTVCVTGAGADGDSVWEQRKLEARKMLENAADSPASSARFVRHCFYHNTPQSGGVIHHKVGEFYEYDNELADA